MPSEKFRNGRRRTLSLVRIHYYIGTRRTSRLFVSSWTLEHLRNHTSTDASYTNDCSLRKSRIAIYVS